MSLSAVGGTLSSIGGSLAGSTIDLITTLASPFYVSHRANPDVYPECSAEGYAASAALALPLETDLRELSDGSLAVIHDATVDRTTDGTGDVSTFTPAAFKALNIDTISGVTGTPILWSEILSTYGGTVLLAPEPKDTTAARNAAVADIVAVGLERAVLFTSFSLTNAQYAAGFGIATMLVSDSADPATLASSDIEFVAVSTAATQTYIDDMQAAGIKVAAYTIDTHYQRDVELARGVDGIFSDDAVWLSEAIAPADTDPYADQRPWSGMVANQYADVGRFVAPDRWGFDQPDTSATQRYVCQGWACPRASDTYVFGVSMEMLADSDAQFRAVDVVAGWDHDIVNNGGTQPRGNGYIANLRRDGRFRLFRFTNGVASQIGSTVETGVVAAAASTGTARVELELTATQVIARRTDTADTITVADSTYRGRYVALGKAGTAVDFYDATVTDT